MKVRFSKAKVLGYIENRTDILQKSYGFTRDDGTHQVETRSPDCNRAYGEWDALLRMAEHLGIE